MMKAATGARIFSIIFAAHGWAPGECRGSGRLDLRLSHIPVGEVAPRLLHEAAALDSPEEQRDEHSAGPARWSADLDQQDDLRLVADIPHLVAIAVIEDQ